MTTETPASAAPAAPAQAAQPAPSAASELPNGAAPVVDGVPASEQTQQVSDPAAPDSEEAARKAAARERFDKRFGDMSKRTRDAELRAARLEGELEALRRGQTPAPAQAPEATSAPKAPNPADYPKGEWDPRYAADLAKYEIREEDRAARQREAEAERKRASESEFEAGKARYEDTLNRARAAADGSAYFQNAERVLELGRVPIAQGGLSKPVIDAITESDNAVHVAEVLGRNPDQVPPELRGLVKSPRELAAMSPSQAQRVIARLDDRIGLILEAARQAKTQTPVQTPTPPPVTPTPTPAPQAPNRGSTPAGEPPRGDFRAFKEWRAKVFGTQ